MSDTKEKQDAITAAGNDNGELEGRLVVNASGHIQELDRQFGLFSICSMGICTDNAWSSQAASIVGSCQRFSIPYDLTFIGCRSL